MLICHFGNQNNIYSLKFPLFMILFRNDIYLSYSGQEDLTRVASCLWKVSFSLARKGRIRCQKQTLKYAENDSLLDSLMYRHTLDGLTIHHRVRIT